MPKKQILRIVELLNPLNKKSPLALWQKLLVTALAIILLSQLSFNAFKITVPIFNRIVGMPRIDVLEDYRPIGSIEIYDYQDNFVGVLQGKENVSDYAKQAVLAIEDTEFYKHSGISITGLFRAFFTNLLAGRIVQGGSTITQQLVKNLFIKEEDRFKKSIFRKLKEFLLAIEIERRYPKDRILEIYLNQVYFGNRAYGIERAAQRYFSKSASKLTLLEGSYLGGLLTAPSYLSTNDEQAFKRQRQVLKRMKEHGYITKDEYKAVKKEKVVFKKSSGNLSKFPYYFSFVEHELKKRYTQNELRKTGLKVYTGLDPVAQRIAKQALEIGIKNAAHGINQGAFVMIDVPSGEVRALVGGVGDFWKYQYNRATNPHTLGSAIKPFVYLTAFMKGVISPSSIILDEPLELKDPYSEDGIWAPKNFDDEFHGPITARAALVFSRNVPAIKVAMKTGIEDIIITAKRAGIKSEMQPLLSLALGAQAFTPLEIASSYGTLARGGAQIDPILIRRITDLKGRLLEKNEAVPKNALPEKDVSLLVELMQEVVQYGTGALAKIPGRIIAGKTGTADGSRDTWFTGFTPDFVATVWAGNEKNEEVLSRYATGGGTPAWIWREFATNYLKEKPRPPSTFAFSENYINVLIDPLTGLKATKYTDTPVMKRFIPGTEPKRYAPIPDLANLDKHQKRKNDLGRIFLGKKKLSEEDKKIRKIEDIRQEEQEEKASESRIILPIPKPKVFKIDD